MLPIATPAAIALIIWQRNVSKKRQKEKKKKTKKKKTKKTVRNDEKKMRFRRKNKNEIPNKDWMRCSQFPAIQKDQTDLETISILLQCPMTPFKWENTATIPQTAKDFTIEKCKKSYSEEVHFTTDCCFTRPPYLLRWAADCPFQSVPATVQTESESKQQEMWTA